jgi:hypothetical protein
VRAAVAAVLALAVIAIAVPAARSADECRGLMVCIPVAGPWVVVPTPSAAVPHPASSWVLRCPNGSIVGGVDARLTQRSLDMSFKGRLGSPVNPGVTTTNEVVFAGVQSGRRKAPSAYRPFAGCIPTAGGGRIPTSLRAPSAVKPGQPTVLRVRTVPLEAGSPVAVWHACAPGERLVSWAQAVGLRQRQQPSVAELRAVQSSIVRRGEGMLARARINRSAGDLQARLQVQLVCTQKAGLP